MANYIKIYIDSNEYDITNAIERSNIKLTKGSNYVDFIVEMENINIILENRNDTIDYIVKSILNRNTSIKVVLNLDFLSDEVLNMYIPNDKSSNFVKYDLSEVIACMTLNHITPGGTYM